MMRKFKKTILAAVAAVSMMMSLVACGSSKEDYENDIKAIVELGDIDEVETSEEFRDAIDDVKVTTKEGKALKKAFEDSVDLMEEMEKIVEDLEDAGEEGYADIEDRALKVMEKQEKLQKKIEDCAEAFIKAAEDAGVEEDFLEDLDF